MANDDCKSPICEKLDEVIHWIKNTYHGDVVVKNQRKEIYKKKKVNAMQMLMKKDTRKKVSVKSKSNKLSVSNTHVNSGHGKG